MSALTRTPAGPRTLSPTLIFTPTQRPHQNDSNLNPNPKPNPNLHQNDESLGAKFDVTDIPDDMMEKAQEWRSSAHLASLSLGSISRVQRVGMKV